MLYQKFGPLLLNSLGVIITSLKFCSTYLYDSLKLGDFLLSKKIIIIIIKKKKSDEVAKNRIEEKEKGMLFNFNWT